MNRHFWLITALAALGIAATAWLGFWQLSRASQKLALQSAISSGAQRPSLAEGALAALARPEDVLFQPVLLRGNWLPEYTVFLDNRQMDAKVGFYVVTPFRLEGQAAVVLVQRGWVPRNFLDRSVLPEVHTPTGLVQVSGLIVPPPAKLYELGSAPVGVIRQNLDMGEFALETGLKLMPVSVQQNGAPSDGLLRDWPAVNTGVAKHQGYAFQWFAISALIAGLYGWFQLVKRKPLKTHVAGPGSLDHD